MNLYRPTLPVPAANAALDRLAAAREKISHYQKGVERHVGLAKTGAEIVGASYLAARLSARLGGIEGKTLFGFPLEAVVGGACLAASVSGAGGAYAEDLAAVGVGALSAVSARRGFAAGLKDANPPAQVSGGFGYQLVGGPIQTAEQILEQTVNRR